MTDPAAEIELLEIEAALASSDDPPHRRPLTPAEVASGTDFRAIAKRSDAAAEQIARVLLQQRLVALDALRKLLESQPDALSLLRRLAELSPVDLAGTSPVYEGLVRQLMAVAKAAVNDTKAEAVHQGIEQLRVDPAPITFTVAAQARQLATIAGQNALEVARKVAPEVVRVPTIAPADAAVALVEAVRSSSTKSLDDAANKAVNAAQGSGRGAGQKAYTGDIVWTASELNDQATCQPCEAIDGTTFDSYAQAVDSYPSGQYDNCLGGQRCRGTLVAVMNESAPTNTDPSAPDGEPEA